MEKEKKSIIKSDPEHALKKDVPILAAVLYAKPDYFLTGDGHFDEDRIKDKISVMSAKEILAFIRNE